MMFRPWLVGINAILTPSLGKQVNFHPFGGAYAPLACRKYSKSPRIRTYFLESQTEIGSYFKGIKTNFRV